MEHRKGLNLCLHKSPPPRFKKSNGPVPRRPKQNRVISVGGTFSARILAVFAVEFLGEESKKINTTQYPVG